MAHRLKLALLAGTTLMGSAAQAQLPDPTRPPVGMAEAAAPADGAAPAAASLQSVIRPKTGRPAALINGQRVELGALIGEARLVLVEEDHVVLLTPQGRETLRLTPAAEKHTKVDTGKTAKPVGLNAVKGDKPK